ncbi:MAG: acyl-CoA synthetase [Candidatus Dormibacteria bacterium]
MEQLRGDFAWVVPAQFNMGTTCSDAQRQSDPALVHERLNGAVETYTFGDLTRMSNALARGLRGEGIVPGDRVAVVLPPSPAAAVSHLAIYKLGAIAVPLSTLFGPDALEVRLRDSGARMVVTDAAGAGRLDELVDELPALERVVLTEPGVSRFPALQLDELTHGDGPSFVPVSTMASDPALLIYTSGTTGPPKGALHAHRVLLGHLPGFELSHEFFPMPGDLFWSPAEWAWIGGLLDVLMPSLFHGRPLLVAEGSGPFDPQGALELMARHGVKNAFIPPTALKMMRRVDARVPGTLRLRTVVSGGEALGEEMHQWARENLGVTVNEIFGQTECNYVVGNCTGLYPVREGSMGCAYPGHEVGIVDEDGRALAAGATGEVAIRQPDPVAFLGYWGNPGATAAKHRGDWLVTGDFARLDEDGYFWYVGRQDDLINSSGHRIGPTEIEGTLMKHPGVALAAVIGVPDAIRGEAVKAFVVPRPGFEPDDRLTTDIQAFVKTRLAAYEYPRMITFVDEIPITTTGKVRRTELRELHRQTEG